MEEGDGIINCSYGPAYYLMKKDLNTYAGFRDLIHYKNLTFHGLMETEKATSRPWKMTNKEYNSLKFYGQLKDRIANSMQQVGNCDPDEAMKQQIYKHGIYLPFLDLHTYAPFAVGVFEKFQFDKLMNHIVCQVETNCRAPVREREYDGVSWLGIQKDTLEGYIKSFQPTREGEIGVRLLQMDADFLTIWQVIMGVTRGRNPGRVFEGDYVVDGCYLYLTHRNVESSTIRRTITPSDFIYIRA